MVSNVNKSLKDKNFVTKDENAILKSALVNLKNLVKEKDEKFQEITADLEAIEKNLRMLNSGITKLDQILNMGQSMNNMNRIGYSGVADSIATMSNTLFVKAASTTAKQPIFW